MLGQHPGHQLAQRHKQQNGEDPRHQKVQKGRILRGNDGGKFRAAFLQTVDQIAILLDAPGLVISVSVFARLILNGEQDHVVLNGDLFDFLLFYQRKKLIVGNLLNPGRQQRGEDQRVEQQQNEHGNEVVENQWLFGSLALLLHMITSCFSLRRQCLHLSTTKYFFFGPQNPSCHGENLPFRHELVKKG